MHAIGALDDQNVRPSGWNLRFDEMAVFFTAVVTSVENLQARYINEEHTGAKNVASMIRDERYPGTRRDLLVR